MFNGGTKRLQAQNCKVLLKQAKLRTKTETLRNSKVLKLADYGTCAISSYIATTIVMDLNYYSSGKTDVSDT